MSQEHQKGFKNAAEAVWKGLTLYTASENFNVPHTMLSRIAKCSGVYKSALSCAINKISSEEEENTCKLHQELIMAFIDVISGLCGSKLIKLLSHGGRIKLQENNGIMISGGIIIN